MSTSSNRYFNRIQSAEFEY